MRELATTSGPLYTVRDESLVRFHPLFLCSSEREQQAWKIGVENSALAIELPVEGARAIQALQAGKSIAETAVILQQEYSEAIDLVDLVQGLIELGMVERIDDYQFGPPELIGQHWLQRIPPAVGGWLYSRASLVVFAVLALVGPLLLVFQPTLRPHVQDLFWFPSYTLDLLMLLILFPLLMLKHELGHLLAARAQGLSAELTFGNRLFYLVAVSRIGGIWKCSRFDRMVIYCAGMVNDCVTASLCILLLFAASHGVFSLPAPLAALLHLLILSEYLGVAWEFQIFLKTDVYHIFTELTGRHDLPEQASALLHSWWRAAFPHFHHLEQQDQSVCCDKLTLGYIALSIVGIGASCLWFIFYGMPATFTVLHGEMTLLVTSIPAKDVLALLDSLAALLIQLLWFLLLGWSVVKKHSKNSFIL